MTHKQTNNTKIKTNNNKLTQFNIPPDTTSLFNHQSFSQTMNNTANNNNKYVMLLKRILDL